MGNLTRAGGSGTTSASDLSSGILPDARMPNLTGDVTTVEGAVATTIAPAAISGKTLVTAVGADHVLIFDATDSALKKSLVSDFAGGVLFADPGADRIAFWDDSAGAFTPLVHSANFSISGTAFDLASSITVSTIDTVAITNSTIGATNAIAATALTSAIIPDARMPNLTGDVTTVEGAVATTIAPAAISGKTLVTAVGADHVLIFDATDSALKKALVSDFGGGSSPLTGLTWSYTSASSTPADTDTDLWTYSLPANTLNVTGKRLHVRITFKFNAGAGNKRLKFAFGSGTWDHGLLANDGSPVIADFVIYRTGASTQKVTGIMDVHNHGNPFAFYTEMTETDTAGITLKAIGYNGTFHAATVELFTP